MLTLSVPGQYVTEQFKAKQSLAYQRLQHGPLGSIFPVQGGEIFLPYLNRG